MATRGFIPLYRSARQKTKLSRAFAARWGGPMLLSFCLTTLVPPAMSQEAVFAITGREVGTPSYNPIASNRLNSVTSLIFDRLLLQDADQSFHGLLARTWESTPDGLRWTFTLKPGVRFHDDTPFNASVIAWWIPKFIGTDNAYMVEAIDRVEVVDDLTVRFHLKKPDPNLLFNLATAFMGIPSPKAYDALGDKFGVTEAIGTGPFKLAKFNVGEETVLVRNDAYAWGSDLSVNRGPAKLKKITLREITDDSTAFLELKTGGIDFLYTVPTDFLPRLSQEPGLKVGVLPGNDVVYMAINTSVAPFTDIRVRAAATYAINQKAIGTTLYGGIGQPATGFLISALEEAKVDPSVSISYDPNRAIHLLEQAGWTLGPDGVRVKDGSKLQVRLWSSSSSEFKRLSQAVQAQLKAVGILADITLFDASTITTEYKKRTGHHLAIRSYSWANADILDWFFSAKRLGYPNVSMLSDPRAEELNDIAMNRSRTWEERVVNFTAYHTYLLSQYAFAPIYQPANLFSYAPKRLKLPDIVRGSRIMSQTVLDMAAVN